MLRQRKGMQLALKEGKLTPKQKQWMTPTAGWVKVKVKVKVN